MGPAGRHKPPPPPLDLKAAAAQPRMTCRGLEGKKVTWGGRALAKHLPRRPSDWLFAACFPAGSAGRCALSFLCTSLDLLTGLVTPYRLGKKNKTQKTRRGLVDRTPKSCSTLFQKHRILAEYVITPITFHSLVKGEFPLVTLSLSHALSLGTDLKEAACVFVSGGT